MRARGMVLGLVMVLFVAHPAASEPVTGPAASVLELSSAATVRDRSPVTFTATWQRTDSQDPDQSGPDPSGSVLLEFRRTGTTPWIGLGGIDVVDGTGSVTLTPRDDGEFRLRHVGDAELAPTVSAPQPLDNVPTERLTLRIGQFNLPGPDKLARPTTRARRAAAQVRAADLDVVMLNEAVGPGRDGLDNAPSAFADTVRRSLGSTWRLVTPTTSFNENYLVYRSDRFALVAQYPDRVIPGIGSGDDRRRTGRHVTPVLLKDRRSNQPVLVAGTHLVNDDRAGARLQALTVADEVQKRSSGYPVVVAGDMNTSDQLTALTDVGLKDARRSASDRSRPTWSTYTRYSVTKPRKVAAWIIDQVYVPSTWSVSRWTTVLDTRKGRFVQPRASDHQLVWAVARSRT